MAEARHLLAIDGLSDDAIRALLDRARALARGAPARPIQATVANLFFEPSTRTRVSFELAARRLSMRVVNIELERSSSTKGETLDDTVATLAAMGVDCLVLRHPQTGRAADLADRLRAGPVLLNGGDGTGEHPSQALLDAATLETAGLEWARSTIAVIGDIRHSRVARSDLKLFARLGAARLRVAGPPELMPERLDDPAIERCESLEQAVRGAHVIMMLRLQRERMDAAGWPDADAYHQCWGLRREHLALAAPGCRVMHPGPLNRGVEIASGVADGPHSLILDQVRMGVSMRMALFEWLLDAGIAVAMNGDEGDQGLGLAQRRRIRSFVHRPGRLTPAQQRALEQLLPAYRIDAKTGDLRAAFERPAELVVEIGFGNGQALAWMAANEPGKNFVGIEVHDPGVGRLLNALEADCIDNVRVVKRDAVEVLEQQAAAASLDEVRIYFPDPWPKKRHHKRRLIQPEFLELISARLKPGGLLHLATDWAPYAESMLEAIAATPALVNQGAPFIERPPWRPRTHFEHRGQKRGHEIFDLLVRVGTGDGTGRRETGDGDGRRWTRTEDRT